MTILSEFWYLCLWTIAKAIRTVVNLVDASVWRCSIPKVTMLVRIYSEPRVEESVIYLSDFKLNAAGRDFAKFGATGRSTLFATTSRALKYENGLSNVVNDKGRYHSRLLGILAARMICMDRTLIHSAFSTEPAVYPKCDCSAAPQHPSPGRPPEFRYPHRQRFTVNGWRLAVGGSESRRAGLE
jgi:hypothetical protein